MTPATRSMFWLRNTLMLFALTAWAGTSWAEAGNSSVQLGHRIYTHGVLPSGDPLTGFVARDVPIEGDFVICNRCHRRSGLGAIEGTTVVPIVVGSMLYEDLAIPTSRPPAPPVLRPAYTRETLARSIREGIGSDGNEFSVLMPRYELTDNEMDNLMDYLESLSVDPDPGVTEDEIHFATVLDDSLPEMKRKALLDVLNAFFEQKNTETRYETKRKESGPWHKDWVFKPYRKWVLHVWELTGPRSGWTDQLRSLYEKQAVFGLISGAVDCDWKPIHDYCEQERLPCLFPTTQLPVIDESDFYTVYLSKGMSMEAGVIARHVAVLAEEQPRVLQVYRTGDAEGMTAALALKRHLGEVVRTFSIPDDERALRDELDNETNRSPAAVVAWLRLDDVETVLDSVTGGGARPRIYLSGYLAGEPSGLPESYRRQDVFVAYSSALPAERSRLLMRSTGWFRAKRIYAPEERAIQANAYFALKVAGGALGYIGSFFKRDYFLESVEHMIDNAIYTSVYPHMSLAPEQRFVSKGGLVASFEKGSHKLVPVTDWIVPDLAD